MKQNEYLRKSITSTIRKYLNESKSYSNNVKFEPSGDYEIEDLNKKLDIINRYFPFSNVHGYYNDESGAELFFDNNIKIKGVFNSEPFIVSMSVNDNKYDIDIHPFDSMGGFSDYSFEKYIKSIYNEENTISLVIGHEGYAVKSFSINKSNINELNIYIVNGTQIEGKVLGETYNGRKQYNEF